MQTKAQIIKEKDKEDKENNQAKDLRTKAANAAATYDIQKISDISSGRGVKDGKKKSHFLLLMMVRLLL